MTLEELMKHYVKAFKKGAKTSETRQVYEQLRQKGQALGIDLNKEFFQKLLVRYREAPHLLHGQSPEEINQDILSQYRSYMEQFQEQHCRTPEIVKKQKKRSVNFEIK